MSDYRLWVNDDRTVLVTLWDSGVMEVARRSHTAETWGPPVYLNEEKQASAGRSSGEAMQANRERG